MMPKCRSISRMCPVVREIVPLMLSVVLLLVMLEIVHHGRHPPSSTIDTAMLPMLSALSAKHSV